jgi:hypothetical protein
MNPQPKKELPLFSRSFWSSADRFSQVGAGDYGGKAQGLIFISDVINTRFDGGRFREFDVDIPRSVVLTTEVFDEFMERNNLYDVALSDMADDRIALAFQSADLPVEIVGDLRALVEGTRQPLAVRSSSLLEDALFRPFAGVYATKMIPNNQSDSAVRFKKLVEAVKFVYASVFTQSAKNYVATTDKTIRDEKMAVLVQEVVGVRCNERFYPHVSGVARSFNFYPSGRARPEEGVINLALGLGKTIVDGGVSWAYSPAHPKAPPPFASARDMLKKTQIDFWAVEMGKPPAFDPINEAEYLVQSDLAAAEYDDTLRHVASTYVSRSERVVPGVGADGARIINFSPLLVTESFPLNALVTKLLRVCEEAVGAKVEIEFAITLPNRASERARFGFLQVRPMVVSEAVIDIADDAFADPDVLVASDRVMGNGLDQTIQDVVYVKREEFDAKFTRQIAGHLELINKKLFAAGRPYLLIGFGRWGSADPWLGIPVDWGQICGARAIVEATLPRINVDPSQGSHFFHNISSFKVSYFSVRHDRSPGIDWEWLNTCPAVTETEFVRHIQLDKPLLVKVDGRSARGVIKRL